MNNYSNKKMSVEQAPEEFTIQKEDDSHHIQPKSELGDVDHMLDEEELGETLIGDDEEKDWDKKSIFKEIATIALPAIGC